jgi:hypothetical protein
MTDPGTKRRARRRNDGLRKLCECPRRRWAKCEHPWHFNFNHKGEAYRFSLERQVRRVAKDQKGVWNRNAINHGEIDAENPEELARLNARASRLWMIVWRMFGCFIPFGAPMDSKVVGGLNTRVL